MSVFYPMGRVERVERDETVGDLEGFSDRYERLTGRDLLEAVGLQKPGNAPLSGPTGARKGTARKRSPFSPIDATVAHEAASDGARA